MTRTTISRIASIDILRALTMALMIFVNDLWSLKNIPAWLEHTAASFDGMGLADAVFPAFLVIVGMSAPFAVASRRKKGESSLQILLHIIKRSAALIIMGVFLVNGESINEQASGMPRYVWNSLSCLAFILIWNDYPKKLNSYLVLVLRILGAVILLPLAWNYRSGDGGQNYFSSSWWGILGLIGWAYLITSTVFILTKQRLVAMVVFWLCCMIYSMAVHSGWIAGNTLLRRLTSPLGDGAMPALVTAGAISSMMFVRFRDREKPLRLLPFLFATGTLLLATGFLCRNFWIISKIKATPTWVLICTGITLLAFAIIYWLADIKQKNAWATLIKPAGTNTLLCYLLPYFAYAIYTSMHITYPDSISYGAAGLLRSAIFSLVIINIAGVLGRLGLRLKL